MSDEAGTECSSHESGGGAKVIAPERSDARGGGYTYFPREAVHMELLPAGGQDERPRLPARRSILRRGRGRQAEPARGVVLQAPKPAMSAVDHWIGFCGGVRSSEPTPAAPASVSEVEPGAFSPSAGRARSPNTFDCTAEIGTRLKGSWCYVK
jgi:hypothetical protein